MIRIVYNYDVPSEVGTKIAVDSIRKNATNKPSAVKTCQDHKEIFDSTLKHQKPCQHGDVILVGSANSSTGNHCITCVECGCIINEERDSVFKSTTSDPDASHDTKFIGTVMPRLPVPTMTNYTLTDEQVAQVLEILSFLIQAKRENFDTVQEQELHFFLDEAVHLSVRTHNFPRTSYVSVGYSVYDDVKGTMK